jgi:hypothetical protein
VKREVKRRQKEDKKFKKLYKDVNKPVKDVVVGASMKAAFTSVSMGIVGFDSIADNSHNLHELPPQADAGPCAVEVTTCQRINH